MRKPPVCRPSLRGNPYLWLAVLLGGGGFLVYRLLTQPHASAGLAVRAVCGLAVTLTASAVYSWLLGRYTLDPFAVKLLPRGPRRPEDASPPVPKWMSWGLSALFYLAFLANALSGTRPQRDCFMLGFVIGALPALALQTRVWRRAWELCRERSG